MYRKAQPAAGILLCLLAFGLAPANAQVASYVDEHGKRVFVNVEPPAVHRMPAGKNAPGLLRATFAEPVASGSSSARRPDPRLERLVNQTAERHKVDPVLVKAVIEAESGWNTGAVSRKGALGLMQLVPGTAQRFGVANVLDPEQNVDAGVRYLRSLLERYDGDLYKSLAAYNAGEHAVDRWRGVPNYRETRGYVQKITDSYFRPGSGRQQGWWNASRPIYRVIDEKGRVVFTNQ